MKSARTMTNQKETKERAFTKPAKLRENMIVNGHFFRRGEIIEESLLPEKFRTEAFVDGSLEDEEARLVMLLLPVTFIQEHQVEPDRKVGYQTTLAPDTLIDLDQLPLRVRKNLVEGTHYIREWIESERVARLNNPYGQGESEDAYEKMTEIYTQDTTLAEHPPRYE